MIDWFNSLLAAAANAVAQGSFGALVTLLLVAALTEIGVPFPLIIDGALVLTSYERGLFSLQVLFVISALILGREAGAAVLFWLSRFAGDAFVNRLAKRLPKLKLKERMVWLFTGLRRHAPLSVAIARLTPGLLFPSSVAAGYSGMHYYEFALGIILASMVADGALVIMGVLTKYGFRILGFTPSAWEVGAVLFLVILLVWFVPWAFLRVRNRKKNEETKSGRA
jgi:membrane protein DedA with SNARE-associated domain